MNQKGNAPVKLDRVPPQNVDAERAVLGAIISEDIGSDAIAKVIEILCNGNGNGNGADAFYKESHQRIYKAIVNLYDRNEPIDLLTLTDELQRTNELAKVGDVYYLDEMIDSVPVATNIEYYAEIIKEEYVRRSIIHKIAKIYNSAFDPAVDTNLIIDEIANIQSAQEAISPKTKSIENAVQFLAREKTQTPYIIEGILPSSGFTTIAGFTGMGKSSLAMQMMLSILAGLPFLNTFQIAPEEYHILYLNLENSEYTIDRLLKSQLTEFKINEAQLANLYLPSCMAMSIDNRNDVRQISKWITDYHINIVVIDPILDAFTGDQNDLTVVRSMIKTFREIDSNICWVLLHHFKKGNHDDDLIQSMLGSIGFANAMTSIMGLRRYSQTVNPAYKKIEFAKTRDSKLPDEIKVCMNPMTRIFEITGEGETFKASNMDMVLAILEEKGPLAYQLLVTEVEMRQGIAERTAKNLIQNALALHKIRTDNGLYSLNKQIFKSYKEQTSGVPK